ncbi:hypothetical protein [Parvularcula maris]|uniref:Uncharacterized protein n=1 Tax=Parvularcula maris TaxID=2965077 RepID=A0A9X2RLI5_9PROT|nr:hypothetical protein [Parvularcula maris]MCQ8186572.1 hypothetical protein [Parvularcula maris]
MTKTRTLKKAAPSWNWLLGVPAAVMLASCGGAETDTAEYEAAEEPIEVAEAEDLRSERTSDLELAEQDLEADVLVVEDDPADLETTAENVTDEALMEEGYEEIEADVVTTELDAEMGETQETRIASIRTDDTLPEGTVTLNEVRVKSVVGDRTFTVEDDEGEELLVVLDQEETPGDETEGRYDITEGQVIDLTGTVREVQDGMIDGEEIEDMPMGTDVYMWADKADIEQRPQ